MGLFQSDDRHRTGDGEADLKSGEVEAGRLGGIAIRAVSRGDIVLPKRAAISLEAGVEGDFRGALAQRKRRPGYAVTLIEMDSWRAAMAQIGADEPWWKRRANLLVESLRLPRAAGTVLAVGKEVLLEVSMECEPCRRMDEVSPGLRAVLTPDWRGGVRARVLVPGEIAIGDTIAIAGA